MARPATRKWLKMGVELEGGWDDDYHKVATKCTGAKGKTDSSVRGMSGAIGEINTKPHTSLESLLEDVETMHPQYTNETAGLHIHTSFSPLDTSMLTSEKFWKYFRARWLAWGEANEGKMTKKERTWFWNRYHERVTGQNYCKAEFKPATQLENHEDKYTQLNFVAYSKYKTVECRLLPMFEQKEITVLAIQELSDIYDSYLNDGPELGVKMEKVLDVTETQEVLEKEEFTCPDISFLEEVTERKGHNLPYGPDISYHIPGASEYMLPFNDNGGVAP